MKKKSRILSCVLMILAVFCIAMYFVYNAKYSSHTVTFDVDGGTTITSQVIENGSKVQRPVDPTKENNDFVEWQLNGQSYDFDSIVKSDITLKAIWKAYNSFNVKITLDDNEYEQKIREGELIDLDTFKIPAKEGYHVKLYSDNDEEYDLSNKVSQDLNLTAKYIELKKYTVKFDSNYGSKVKDITIIEGEKLDEPTTTRDGYIFAGWYLGEEKFDFKTPITKNITLKAKWNEAGKVTVTFTVDGKTYETSAVKENTKVTKPNNPTKKGYRFVEWQLNGTKFDFNTKITGDTELTALFEEAKSYIVTFNSDGGSKVSSQDVTSKATKPNNPTKEGYVFVEWQLNGKTYNFNQEVVEDITLKAKWEKKKAKYTVTFDSMGGSNVDSQTVVEGEKAKEPSKPTKDGYSFDEWIYNYATFDFTTPITGDITLIARYHQLKQFTVTFDTNGGSNIDSKVVTEGSTVARPSSNPTKSGSTFVEWQLNGSTYDFSKAVTSSITLTAKWQDETSNPDITDEEK